MPKTIGKEELKDNVIVHWNANLIHNLFPDAMILFTASKPLEVESK